jgi:hypothetical protein
MRKRVSEKESTDNMLIGRANKFVACNHGALGIVVTCN